MAAKIVSIKSKHKKQEPSTPAEPLDEYQKQVSSGSVESLPYDRLMIHFRKNKDYGEELKVIKKGIATLKKFYANAQRSSLKKINPKIKALSHKIGKSMGLIDKKGNEVYLPEPLPRWIKRQHVVEEKIRKQKKSQ
jgi:hypothetical protein